MTIDEERYRAVIKACCLDQDISDLPDGDETQVGSSGVNLSGGQKQRLVSFQLAQDETEAFD